MNWLCRSNLDEVDAAGSYQFVSVLSNIFVLILGSEGIVEVLIWVNIE
jgi:hypothetical protein